MLGPLTNSLNMKYKLHIREYTFYPFFFNVIMNLRVHVFHSSVIMQIPLLVTYFRYRFAININRCTLNDNIQKIKLSTAISDDEQLTINHNHGVVFVKCNKDN